MTPFPTGIPGQGLERGGGRGRNWSVGVGVGA